MQCIFSVVYLVVCVFCVCLYLFVMERVKKRSYLHCFANGSSVNEAKRNFLRTHKSFNKRQLANTKQNWTNNVCVSLSKHRKWRKFDSNFRHKYIFPIWLVCVYVATKCSTNDLGVLRILFFIFWKKRKPIWNKLLNKFFFF